MVMGASLTKDTKAQPYTTQDRTMHYAPPDFRGSQSASARLTHPPIFTCSRSLSPFHSRSNHPDRRHPRPSLDAQPSDPHPGSIPAARRLCHCHPSAGWEIPFAFLKPPSSAPPSDGKHGLAHGPGLFLPSSLDRDEADSPLLLPGAKRTEGRVPAARPDRSLGSGGRGNAAYIELLLITTGESFRSDPLD